MDEPPCLQSHTCPGAPSVGCNGTDSCLVDTKVEKKTVKNKKGKHKKKKGAACQMKVDSEYTRVAVEEQSSASEIITGNHKNKPAGSKHDKNSQKRISRSISPVRNPAIPSPQKPSTKPTCDQSTQTDSLQFQSIQTQSTQTPPIQGIHTTSTETKCTQTNQSSFYLHQAYWGKSFTDQSADEQKAQSSASSNHLTVISWNIDGLDFENVIDRVKGLLSHLGKYRADVVLLQELVSPCVKILKNVMKDYQFLESSEDCYFSGILLRKDRVQFVQSNIVKYPTTEQGRNLLIANVSFSGHPLCIMTSHLESCKTGSQERLNQLRRVWKWMKENPEDHTVIFGGDTNLRDWEVKKLGGLPDGISDVWEMLGEPEESRYTWDMSINDNKDIPNPIRLRFDRLFLKGAANGARLRPKKHDTDWPGEAEV